MTTTPTIPDAAAAPGTTFVTVAIPYVNAAPHLGYAYELVAADVYARARRAAGDDVRLLGGTDDYALKNVLAAEAAGVSTPEYVAEHAARFAALAAPLDIAFDDFVRTSADPRHAPAVERLWRRCAEAGDLYRRTYEGDYCVGCERFYTADEAVDGHCPEHLTGLERVAEENWFFRLSRHRSAIERLVASGELEVHPRQFRDEVLAFVRGGLDDISVSRTVRRARGWGIGVPDDPTQVIYVWFDALTNYLSSLDFGDPASEQYRRWWEGADRRVHVIGKGILRFHAVYWPAFLLSAGLPVPTRIEVHPYLTVGGAKISKSGPCRGVADPFDVAERYGTDALRWWFARDVSAVADTDFTEPRLVQRANEDLANGFGNVVNRIRSLVARRPPSSRLSPDELPIPAVTGLAGNVARAIADFDHRGATELLLEAVDALEPRPPGDGAVAARRFRPPGRPGVARRPAGAVPGLRSHHRRGAGPDRPVVVRPAARRARRSGCVGPTGAAARALAPALSSAALFGRARRDRETMAETHP